MMMIMIKSSMKIANTNAVLAGLVILAACCFCSYEQVCVTNIKTNK